MHQSWTFVHFADPIQSNPIHGWVKSMSNSESHKLLYQTQCIVNAFLLTMSRLTKTVCGFYSEMCFHYSPMHGLLLLSRELHHI